jgi:hypothetical protein
MKNLLVVFGLCSLLASEVQATAVDKACLQENGRFTYDHPTEGKLTDLTQVGLDSIRVNAKASITSTAGIGECPKPRVSVVSSLKNWFKQFTADEEQPTGSSTKDKNSTHTAKSGDFEAVMIMTQDSNTVLTQNFGLNFTMFEDVTSINIGEGIEALLLVRGCSENSSGHCLVEADYVIEAPDGSTYQQALNTNVWKETKPATLQYSLTNTRMGFVIQSGSEPGLYTVYATVSDRTSNTELLLTGKVIVRATLPEENGKIQGSLEEPKNPWHETISSGDLSVNTE